MLHFSSVPNVRTYEEFPPTIYITQPYMAQSSLITTVNRGAELLHDKSRPNRLVAFIIFETHDLQRSYLAISRRLPPGDHSQPASTNDMHKYKPRISQQGHVGLARTEQKLY